MHKEIAVFLKALVAYLILRIRRAGLYFEKYKSFLVNILMVRRGANTSLFLHGSILGLAISVLVAGGVISSNSVVSGSYPGIPANPLVAGTRDDLLSTGVITSTITPVTIISDKPRDKIFEYTVVAGDTISSIAKEYGVSENTILWENDLSTSSIIRAGQKLSILPVSGVAAKVASGDTIYSVAKKYQANAQAIIDFPFNDIGDDFQLTSGQVLIVPDGAPPEKPKPVPTQYLAQQNIPVADLGSATFIWPASGDLSQYFAWYHPGLDISSLSGGPILAADAGTVTVAGWPDNYGYGNRVIIDHGNGYTTLYAHLSAIYVAAGQTVSKADAIGAMGSTGRSTGTHLHIEIRNNGTPLNPLGILGK